FSVTTSLADLVQKFSAASLLLLFSSLMMKRSLRIWLKIYDISSTEIASHSSLTPVNVEAKINLETLDQKYINSKFPNFYLFYVIGNDAKNLSRPNAHASAYDHPSNTLI
ncbi:hypothetical protein HAX54_027027, partial [Datura stramonium]|nr:hypothetical protein [Datura stramonium]